MKWKNLSLLAIAALLGMSLWFSVSAAIPQLTKEWNLSSAQQSWLTMSVQLGFVAGALFSAALNLGDRIATQRLFAACAFAGGAMNAAIPLFNPGLHVTFVLRFLTGAALAGVYPPGMKLMATWCKEDRGFGIGLLVAALTLGKALPHLMNAFSGGMPSWRSVLVANSAMAWISALIALFLVQPGPYLAQSAPFNWRFGLTTLKHQPSRLANFGYLGHMWELYAMWTWVPIFLIASFESAHWTQQAARIAGFSALAAGSAGCIVAGILSDRFGRTIIASASLIISGTCCLIVGLFFHHPAITTAICIVWGFAVVADSAQFSAAVSELADPRYVGTALTMQTCLGFLLTMLTIRIVPSLKQLWGWEHAFLILAPGPVFGIINMLRLRKLPEATKMASGHR